MLSINKVTWKEEIIIGTYLFQKKDLALIYFSAIAPERERPTSWGLSGRILWRGTQDGETQSSWGLPLSPSSPLPPSSRLPERTWRSSILRRGSSWASPWWWGHPRPWSNPTRRKGGRGLYSGDWGWEVFVRQGIVIILEGKRSSISNVHWGCGVHS